MEEVEIETIQDYLKLIKGYKENSLQNGDNIDFLFRGQTGDYPLMPKLCRLKPKGDLLVVERLLLQEFKRTNPLLIGQHHPLDDWDYLTLGQHFGLPTRLLDWSNNALTALWFATGQLNYQNENKSSDSLIWILMAADEDFHRDLENSHPLEMPQTKLIMPRIIRQRINNQSGVFSITSTTEITERQSLNESNFYKEKLIKVKIPAQQKENIRKDLHTLGVNAFSIFPELEGLCAYLQWRYFDD